MQLENTIGNNPGYFIVMRSTENEKWVASIHHILANVSQVNHYSEEAGLSSKNVFKQGIIIVPWSQWRKLWLWLPNEGGRWVMYRFPENKRDLIPQEIEIKWIIRTVVIWVYNGTWTRWYWQISLKIILLTLKALNLEQMVFTYTGKITALIGWNVHQARKIMHLKTCMMSWSANKWWRDNKNSLSNSSNAPVKPNQVGMIENSDANVTGILMD